MFQSQLVRFQAIFKFENFFIFLFFRTQKLNFQPLIRQELGFLAKVDENTQVPNGESLNRQDRR